MKLRASKVLALALALVLALTLALPAAAADYPAETGELDLSAKWNGKVVLLHLNDTHGALSGYAVAAHLKQRLQNAGAEVLLIDCGDFSQGEISVNSDGGVSAVKVMNAAGCDLAIPGNHELDYGQEQLLENAASAQFPFLCANMSRGGELLFPASWTFTARNGLKLGFFGLNTPETTTKANPRFTEGLTFLADKALYDCATQQAAALRADGADLVIALTHLGVNSESEPNRSEDLYANASGIDLILDGHSHTVMTAGEDGAPIQSTGTKSAYVGVVVIDKASKTIERRFLVPIENAEQDPVVSALVAQIDTAVDEGFGEVIGRSEVTLDGARETNRTGETNNGDLASDAVRDCLLAHPEALHADADHVIGLVNGGSIRAAINPGDVTRRDVNMVHPFGNSLCALYVTGAQLLEALEASTFATPKQNAGFPQTAGLTWTLDTTKPFDQGEQYPGTTYYAPASIRRVRVENVNGRPFSLTDTYVIACSDFIAAGGDTYYAFKSVECFDTGTLIDQVVTDYIQNSLGGVIGADYAAPRGNLTILTEENSVCLPSPQTFTLDGHPLDASPEVYNINGENYAKLRDVAMLLTGTRAQFEVTYDSEQNAVAIETGKPYTPVGGELNAHPDRSGAFAVSPQTLSVDGQALTLCAYNLAGNNFYRLRDLSAALDFGVDYAETGDAVALFVAAAEPAA